MTSREMCRFIATPADLALGIVSVAKDVMRQRKLDRKRGVVNNANPNTTNTNNSNGHPAIASHLAAAAALPADFGSRAEAVSRKRHGSDSGLADPPRKRKKPALSHADARPTLSGTMAHELTNSFPPESIEGSFLGFARSAASAPHGAAFRGHFVSADLVLDDEPEPEPERRAFAVARLGGGGSADGVAAAAATFSSSSTAAAAASAASAAAAAGTAHPAKRVAPSSRARAKAATRARAHAATAGNSSSSSPGASRSSPPPFHHAPHDSPPVRLAPAPLVLPTMMPLPLLHRALPPGERAPSDPRLLPDFIERAMRGADPVVATVSGAGVELLLPVTPTFALPLAAHHGLGGPSVGVPSDGRATLRGINRVDATVAPGARASAVGASAAAAAAAAAASAAAAVSAGVAVDTAPAATAAMPLEALAFASASASPSASLVSALPAPLRTSAHRLHAARAASVQALHSASPSTGLDDAPLMYLAHELFVFDETVELDDEPLLAPHPLLGWGPAPLSADELLLDPIDSRAPVVSASPSSAACGHALDSSCEMEFVAQHTLPRAVHAEPAASAERRVPRCVRATRPRPLVLTAWSFLDQVLEADALGAVGALAAAHFAPSGKGICDIP